MFRSCVSPPVSVMSSLLSLNTRGTSVLGDTLGEGVQVDDSECECVGDTVIDGVLVTVAVDVDVIVEVVVTVAVDVSVNVGVTVTVAVNVDVLVGVTVTVKLCEPLEVLVCEPLPLVELVSDELGVMDANGGKEM